MSFSPESYYGRGYFSGEGSDSPYPRDQRYLNPHHPVIDRKFHNLWDSVNKLHPVRHSGILRVLDVGCGPAHTEAVFKTIDPEVHVWNLERYDPQFSREKGASRIACADLRSLPYQSGFFGAVTIWDVIEHVSPSEAQRAINEAYRVLDKDGVLAIRTPNKVTWTEKYRLDTSHVWFPTSSIMRDMLANAGFDSESFSIKTRGFPGTTLYELLHPKGGDLYLPWLGGVIIATAKKKQ